VFIAGSTVRVFCSDTCLRKQAEPIEEVIALPVPEVTPSRRRLVMLSLTLVAVAGAAIAWTSLDYERVTPLNVALLEMAPAEPVVASEPAVVVEKSEPDKPLWTVELASDVWLHPLAGPHRRMPSRDSRVFGASRPGARPVECRNGHCGVDLGGEAWGEPVLAVHDGIVDHVERNPHHPRGGMYVRLAHRDSSVLTQYFHLAAIPRDIKVGAEVRAADVIGLVGETGVHNSEPHLHFTIAVRPDADAPEQYIDPEPLIALWPVARRVFGSTASTPSTHVLPGRPLGPHRKGKRKKRKRRRPSDVTNDEASSSSAELIEPSAS
jgi:murein DD-endopeptidase MepM/ murein hydrolase activator NlpD